MESGPHLSRQREEGFSATPSANMFVWLLRGANPCHRHNAGHARLGSVAL